MSAAGDTAAEDHPRPRPAGPGVLFGAFTRLALQGFGGVLPVAQRELVERLGWLSREQFLSTLSLAQVLPGPNVINLALMIGHRFFGWRGAAAALGGMLCAPLALVLVLAALAAQGQQQPWLAGALRGMGVVSAGLVLATAVKLAAGLRHSPMGRGPCALAVALTVLTVGLLRWPLVAVVVGLGGAMMAYAAFCLRGRSGPPPPPAAPPVPSPLPPAEPSPASSPPPAAPPSRAARSGSADPSARPGVLQPFADRP